MSLQLGFHGGKCCGIKVIFGFPYPYYDEWDRKQPACEKKDPVNLDANGSNVSSDKPFFTDEAPGEGPDERLDRLISFCEKRRPKGIIEVTLATGSHGFNQTIEWTPKLLERKFKIVNECKNSNSGNTVFVFHRNSGEV